MSNQEMQFADPDWKPTQPLDKKTSSQEQETFIPQPINADLREQSKWRTAPPSPTQQEGYAGLRPYAGPTPQQMQAGDVRQRQYRRRGRGPWSWIILAIIIISLMSGGFGSFNGFGRGRFDGNPFPVERQPSTYTVSGQSTIVVNDANGAVQVNVGQSNTEVSIQASPEGNFNDNPNENQVKSSRDGNTINASVQDGQPGPVDLIVTVPQGTNLQLIASGDINVNGVDGQMTLTTSGGSINASNDVMTGSSTLTTTSGDITFGGSIDAGGTYKFQTGSSGSINITVPGNSAFHVDASTNSGSIDASAFPTVRVQNNNHTASGNVGGNAPGATMILNTDSGDINLHQG